MPPHGKDQVILFVQEKSCSLSYKQSRTTHRLPICKSGKNCNTLNDLDSSLLLANCLCSIDKAQQC